MYTNMIEKLKRYAPPGADVNIRIKRFFRSIAAGLVYCFTMFFGHYLTERECLFTISGAERFLRPGAVMPDFPAICKNMFLFHGILILLMVGIMAGNYASYYRGSKSIYLMKRLPNPMERYWRCLALPLAGIFIIVLTALAALLICFGIYMLCTPAECLLPGQWQSLRSVIICWK